jgi:uncharacterized protein YbjT (DUF2867 family)
MKVVVIGGSGLIGSQVVAMLTEHGHEAVAASPSSGVNTITGAGVAEALAGADVVVDVSNSPSFEDKAVLEFFETSTAVLLKAEAEAGVGHHVALSVVGTQRLGESGYIRAKIAQERLIRSSHVPYTIVRATQFFEFFQGIADTATVGSTVRLPPVFIQPIASADVAKVVARTSAGEPVNGVVQIGGPQKLWFDEFVRAGLSVHNDPRDVVVDPEARYFGAKLAEHTLVAGENAELGEITFADWLSTHS